MRGVHAAIPTAIHNKKNYKIKERGKNLKLTDNVLSDQESNQVRLPVTVVNFVLTGSCGFCCIKTAKCVKWSHEQVVCVAFHRIIAQPSSTHLPLLLSLSRCENTFFSVTFICCTHFRQHTQAHTHTHTHTRTHAQA